MTNGHLNLAKPIGYMARRRARDGQFEQKSSLDDVMALFDDIRGPVLTTKEVAEQFDCTTELARQKFQRLEDQGRVASKSPGRDTV